MKQITSSPSDLPYTLVNFGVDTLILNVRYADEFGKPLHSELTEGQIDRLNEWQAMAKEEEQPVPTPCIFQGANLFMHPHGAGKGQWRWLLTNDWLNLCISRGRLNGIIAQVRLSALLLWSRENPVTHRQDLWKLLGEVQAFLTTLLQVDAQTRLHLQVSEVHVCADMAGWDVSTCFDWQATMLTRARRRVPRSSFSLPEPDDCQKHGCAAAVPAGSFLWQGPDQEVPTPIYHGHRLETLEFGSHGSALSCSIYNKSREIKKSGKTWFEDIWRSHGYDGSSDVWRVEFRWKREAMHHLKQDGVFHGIESLADLKRYLPYIWTYSAGHVQGGEDGLPDGWLRYVERSEDSNPARWPVHPAWQVVQSAFTTHTETAVNVHTGEVVDLAVSLPLVDLIRERQRQRNEKRLAQQIGGCCSTLAAWLTPRDASEPLDFVEVFFWLEKHLPVYALPELAEQATQENMTLDEVEMLLQERYLTNFAETVLDKQVRYNLRSTSEL
ncbi:MAG TPA: hypothetical protein VFV38_00180 [Ktedonobacteraceae bacterium]|nr:hypothetical protein [Ktedonobacteraceae bacterium]